MFYSVKLSAYANQFSKFLMSANYSWDLCLSQSQTKLISNGDEAKWLESLDKKMLKEFNSNRVDIKGSIHLDPNEAM